MKKKITLQEYIEIETQIKNLQRELENSEVTTEWYETKNTLEIEVEDGKLVLEANYNSWLDAVDKDDPLLIEITDEYNSSVISLSFEQMRELKDYLAHMNNFILIRRNSVSIKGSK